VTRTLWLALRLALFFGLLVAVVLFGAAIVARHTVGRPLHEPLPHAAVHRGLAIAQEVSETLPGRSADRVELERRLEDLSSLHGLSIALLDENDEVVASSADRGVSPWQRELRELPCPASSCRASRGPGPRIVIGLEDAPGRIVSVEVMPPGPTEEAFDRFYIGLVLLGLVALVGLFAIAYSLSRPVRMMSRSMDRIARGDLDHRVVDKGRDEHAQMARSFNTMTDRLVRIIRGQRELLAGASHELRSPLARMKLGIELVRERGAEPSRLDELEGEIDTLDALVGELLAASRQEIANQALSVERVEVASLLEESWAKAVDRAPKDIDPELELDIAADIEALALDRGMASRLFENLFHNALCHGRSPVTLRCERADGRARFVVADSGEGVPEKVLERLFDPFFRVDTSRSRRTGGTGLGLMVVRRAVEASSGTVNATKASGGGLAISFDLPLWSGDLGAAGASE